MQACPLVGYSRTKKQMASCQFAHLDKNFVWKNLEVVESCDHAKPMNMVEKHRKKTTVKE